jgi:hypothetical protein
MRLVNFHRWPSARDVPCARAARRRGVSGRPGRARTTDPAGARGRSRSDDRDGSVPRTSAGSRVTPRACASVSAAGSPPGSRSGSTRRWERWSASSWVRGASSARRAIPRSWRDTRDPARRWPRSADSVKAALVDALPTAWRVVNTNDEVPKLQPAVAVVFEGNEPEFFFYEHVGSESSITFGEPKAPSFHEASTISDTRADRSGSSNPRRLSKPCPMRSQPPAPLPCQTAAPGAKGVLA